MITIEQEHKMKDLIQKLNKYTVEYDCGNPSISDKEWDDMYFTLAALEEETGIYLPSSPTQKIIYNTVTSLQKVEHNHPMLSLDKTKDLTAVKSFLGNHDWIAMAKMDGLTCSLRYFNGNLISAETRGNGIIGEDITHNAMVIPSIPKTIDQKEDTVIDGEIICTYNNFENFKDTYKNPRNFASGSIRLLDSKECFKRHLTFVAWDIVKGRPYDYLSQNLAWAVTQGFYTVPSFIDKDTELEEVVNIIKNKSTCYSYPIDGIVFKYDSIKEYEAAGRTDHHFKGGLAFKLYDELYDTRLRYISWTMGRMGVLTPVAVFDPVEIDGTEISRASLHNVSVMRKLLGECAYVGEPLKIFKANQIIPQVAEAGPYYDYGYIISHGGTPANDCPETCPVCHGEVNIKENNGVEVLICENPLCSGKLINKLDHFCSKKGLDIKGLSKATLEKLIDWGWINSLIDIFTLKNHKVEWINQTGFGEASVNKILSAIEEARECSSEKYVCALGIPLFGKVASEALIKTFGTYKDLRTAIDNKDDKLYQIAGVGEVMINTLLNYDFTEADTIFNNFIKEKVVSSVSTGNKLQSLSFVITGKLQSFKNRAAAKAFIEENGGNVKDSITTKTNYLINNDINSTSSKNATAKKLNIPIITEQQLRDMVESN